MGEEFWHTRGNIKRCFRLLVSRDIIKAVPTSIGARSGILWCKRWLRGNSNLVGPITNPRRMSPLHMTILTISNATILPHMIELPMELAIKPIRGIGWNQLGTLFPRTTTFLKYTFIGWPMVKSPSRRVRIDFSPTPFLSSLSPITTIITMTFIMLLISELHVLAFPHHYLTPPPTY